LQSAKPSSEALPKKHPRSSEMTAFSVASQRR